MQLEPPTLQSDSPARQLETVTGAMSRFGHALSDPTRTKVLLALTQNGRFSGDLAEEIGVSRQGLSNHLACLRGCGLVVATPVGRRVRYDLADSAISRALAQISQLVLVVDPNCSAELATDDCCTIAVDGQEQL